MSYKGIDRGETVCGSDGSGNITKVTQSGSCRAEGKRFPSFRVPRKGKERIISNIESTEKHVDELERDLLQTLTYAHTCCTPDLGMASSVLVTIASSSRRPPSRCLSRTNAKGQETNKRRRKAGFEFA